MTRAGVAPAVVVAALIALLGGCGGEDAEPRLIAAVGDSITAGAPGWDPDPQRRELLNAHDPESQWEHWAAAELGDDYEFRNCGVPGDRTDEIAARLDACIDGADIVVLQGGVNDLAQGHTPAYAARNLRTMVERVRDAGLPLLVANVLPVNRDYRSIRPAIRKLNRMIDAIARDQGVEVVDFFGTLEDERAGDSAAPAVDGGRCAPVGRGLQAVGPRRRERMPERQRCDALPMRLSARNQLKGSVRSINRGAAIANVEIDVEGQRVVASITVEAVEALELGEGDEVTAVIKASDVMIAKD